MVHAAVADVIGPAVTAEGPDGLLGQEFLVVANKYGIVTAVIFDSGQQGIADCPGLCGIITVFQISFAGFLSDAICCQSGHSGNQLLLDGILTQQITVTSCAPT